MIVCNNCIYKNREGYYFCENCGFPLDIKNRERVHTTRLETTGPVGATLQLQQGSAWGTARLTAESEIYLLVNGESESLQLNIEKSNVIGREDSSSNNFPDIDLVPFGGVEKGVSRIHAKIERSEDTLTIVDLGSSNGTYLNGQRLLPKQPRVLRDGDEIRFGKLAAHIYFK